MYTRSTCGGIEMELDKLGVGSIVEVDGNLYKKRVDGWVVLAESVSAYMGAVQEFKVIRGVEKGPLDDFVEGDIISFMTSGGVRVAVKTRESYWQIVGAVPEITSQDIIGFSVDGSVRKVGSISGES